MSKATSRRTGVAHAGRTTNAVVDSPVGPLTLVAVDGVLSRLHMDAQAHRPDDESFGEPDPSGFEAVTAQLAEYFAGERTDFDVPLELVGTPFQQRVWKELQAIEYGTTISYGQLADRIGQPTAYRAVGLANGRNPVGIIVPCHRVVASDGTMGGYGGGLERKQLLLTLERARRSGDDGAQTALAL